MVCEDTLRIRNLPRELTAKEKEDFLRHFGATYVKLVTSEAKQQTVAFARFETKEAARAVMMRLHQVQVLTSRLCVEFAQHGLDTRDHHVKPVESNEKTHTHIQSFISKLTAWNSSVSFHQPPPPHLKYAYPKANRATINNIAHALASVPKFYTQVLHLMNKMNLPPPFSDIPDPPQLRPRPHPIAQAPPPKPTEPPSSESEMESDGETPKPKDIVPVKRLLPPKKQIKRPKFIKPPITAPVAANKSTERAEDVFEMVDMSTRRIELKVSADHLPTPTIATEQNEMTVGTFGVMQLPDKEATPMETDEAEGTPPAQFGPVQKVMSDEELAANRIVHQLDVVPAFKNYHPGVPSCRLYVKNIAKGVEVGDLEYIYRRYVSTRSAMEEERACQFDVRLMQEGRMKGQAFVTLETVELAQRALRETNGFILKEKPLVVVFARSAAPKK